MTGWPAPRGARARARQDGCGKTPDGARLREDGVRCTPSARRLTPYAIGKGREHAGLVPLRLRNATCHAVPGGVAGRHHDPPRWDQHRLMPCGSGGVAGARTLRPQVGPRGEGPVGAVLGECPSPRRNGKAAERRFADGPSFGTIQGSRTVQGLGTIQGLGESGCSPLEMDGLRLWRRMVSGSFPRETSGLPGASARTEASLFAARDPALFLGKAPPSRRLRQSVSLMTCRRLCRVST
jgi:hypothetical protein